MAIFEINSSNTDIDIQKLKLEIESASSIILAKVVNIEPSTLGVKIIIDAPLTTSSTQLNTLKTSVIDVHNSLQRKRVLVHDLPDGVDAASNKQYVDTVSSNILNQAKDYVDVKVAEEVAKLVGTAPTVLDTLGELSDALGDDANFSTTVSNRIGAAENRLDDLEARPNIVNLDSISDVAVTSPSNNQVLKYTGTQWENSILAAVAISNSYIDLNNKPTLASFTTLTSPTSGQVLQYNGTNWVNGDITATDVGGLATVATTGAYSDLIGKPNLATVATTGSYTDLINVPQLTTSLSQLTDVTITTPQTNEVLKYDGTNWINSAAPETGITTLNTLTGANQTFAVGTQGTNFNITSSGTTHTFNLPDASASNRGLITTGAQTISGVKTFSSAPVMSALTASLPLKLDASKNIISSGINLASSANEVSGALGIGNGGTGQTTAQAAINALTQVTSAANEQVLTKDTNTGNATWKTITSSTYAIPNGSVSSPSLYFQTATNMGLYKIADNRLGFVANGQPALSVDGQSGVGRLAVGDLTYLTNSQAVSRLQLIDDNNNTASGITLGGNPSYSVQIYKSANNTLNLSASTITTAGKIGIGTTVPGATLNVVGSQGLLGEQNVVAHFQASQATTSDGGIAIGCLNGNAPYIAATKQNGTSLPLRLRTANTDRILIGTDGVTSMYNGLVINHSSPTIYLQDTNHRSSMIHVDGNTFHILRGSATNSTSWEQFEGKWPLTISLENNDATFGRDIFARYATFSRGDGEIGGAITIANNAKADWACKRWVFYNMAYVPPYGYAHAFQLWRYPATDNQFLLTTSWSDYDGSLTHYGIINHYGQYNVSDYRIKQNVETVTGGLSTILSLNPVTYNFTEIPNVTVDVNKKVGFIAHEVAEIIPHIVKGNKDGVDQQGKPEYQNLDYTGVIPYLVSAVKEQQELIKNLENKIQELENKLATNEN